MRGVGKEGSGVVKEEIILGAESGGPEEGKIGGVAGGEEVDVWV